MDLLFLSEVVVQEDDLRYIDAMHSATFTSLIPT